MNDDLKVQAYADLEKLIAAIDNMRREMLQTLGDCNGYFVDATNELSMYAPVDVMENPQLLQLQKMCRDLTKVLNLEEHHIRRYDNYDF